MGCLSKEGQYPSTGPPTYQIIKVTNASHMSMMKTSLTIILMCPWKGFALYKSSSRLILCYKRIEPPCFSFVALVTCYPLRIILLPNYLLPITSMPAENTLLKTACQFLLLLVGFDTLTYRKDLKLIPYTCGSSTHTPPQPLPRSKP